MDQMTRARIWLRDAGRCQMCGHDGTDVHHRVRRRDGGDEDWNLILLCREHHSWAHGHPEQARERGYIISPFIPHDEAMVVRYTDWRGRSKSLAT